MTINSENIAVLDLGTNTFNLVIGRLNDYGKIELLVRDRQVIKLGMDGMDKKWIPEDAQLRAINALIHFNKIIKEYGVTQTIATATSAFRNAENGQELADKIFIETGIKIIIISGDKEAELIYQGVKSAISLGNRKSLIMDIGGGSVEFIICNEDEIFYKESFEIGAQRLFTTFHTSDPIPSESITDLKKHLYDQLSPLLNAIKEHKPMFLIGTSGAFDTFSQIAYTRTGQTRLFNESHDHKISYPDFCDIHQELIDKTRTERLQISGMVEMRVDMIAVASILLKFVLDQSRIKKIHVSAYALREGLLNIALKKLAFSYV